MTKPVDSISRGLHEAILHAKGGKIPARVHRPADMDVAALRKNLGFTQAEFAAKFCISLGTLRHWERGDRKPHGPALVLLHIAAREPEAIFRALA